MHRAAVRVGADVRHPQNSGRLYGMPALSLGVLLTLLGCNEPTCQSACEKSFQTCGMGQLYASTEDPPTQAEQIQACATACSGSMLDDEQAGGAAGWVSCVDAFSCVSESDWSQLCLTCDAGYFKGSSTGLTCNAARELASAW